MRISQQTINEFAGQLNGAQILDIALKAKSKINMKTFMTIHGFRGINVLTYLESYIDTAEQIIEDRVQEGYKVLVDNERGITYLYDGPAENIIPPSAYILYKRVIKSIDDAMNIENPNQKNLFSKAFKRELKETIKTKHPEFLL